MNIENQSCAQRGVRLLEKKARRTATLVAFVLLIAGGCGGGSNSDPGETATPPPASPPPSVGVVTVTDAFGAPVAGADVRMLRNEGVGFDSVGVITNQDGKAEYSGGPGSAYGAVATAPDMYGSTYDPIPSSGDRVDFAVTLHPSADLAGGVGQISITARPEGGRALTFQGRLWVINESAAQDLEDWNLGEVSVLPCEPDVGADAMIFEADCVEGPPGFDAAYQGSAVAASWVDPGSRTGPLAISLLVDQGGSVVVTDPADRRLLAAKYIQTRLQAEDQVALAAFAADQASTGDVALLPSQPVTIFPVDNPGFTSDLRGYFPTIDSLAAMEGGVSPLLPAVGELLEFTASAAPADSQRTVVVLASAALPYCGVAEECLAARESLLEESTSTDVPIVAVSLADPSGVFDRKGLGPFAQAAQGAVFWARDARQVPTIFGRLPAILDGRHGAVDVTIQLQSMVAGAFASGNTVAGTIRIEVCPWDCDQSVDIPFGFRIP